MPDFLFQIKGKNEQRAWLWPPLWTDKVTASDAKQARLMVEEQFGIKMPGRVMRKDIETQTILLIIKEIKPEDTYTLAMWDKHQCKLCAKEYTLVERYQLGYNGGGQEFCSYKCSKEYNTVASYVEAFNQSGNGKHPPVIYKVTNKINGMCYIGKTMQAFTFRWYQHFFQGRTSKFHKAIKTYAYTDWTFEVIEIVQLPSDTKNISTMNDFIFSREMHWINHYDSIKNGYNSVNSKNEFEEEVTDVHPNISSTIFECLDNQQTVENSQ